MFFKKSKKNLHHAKILFSKKLSYLLKNSLHILQLAKNFITFFVHLLKKSKKNLQIKKNFLNCFHIFKKGFTTFFRTVIIKVNGIHCFDFDNAENYFLVVY